MYTHEKTKLILKNAICEIAKELDINIELTRLNIENLNLDELIEEFVEMKELRLREENLRLVGLIIGQKEKEEE